MVQKAIRFLEFILIRDIVKREPEFDMQDPK